MHGLSESPTMLAVLCVLLFDSINFLIDFEDLVFEFLFLFGGKLFASLTESKDSSHNFGGRCVGFGLIGTRVTS